MLRAESNNVKRSVFIHKILKIYQETEICKEKHIYTHLATVYVQTEL